MRKNAFRTIIGGSLLLNTAFAPAALAQTADQLINQLKPTGSLSDTTRGIKPLAPNDTASSLHGVNLQAHHKPISQASMNEGGGGAMSNASNGAPSANLAIAFKSGSAELTPHAMAQLDQLGKALTSAQLASYNFKIVGHTDTVGQADTNQSLSDQRAQAVKSYLQSKFSVPDTRLQATGVGENSLLVQTPPQTPEWRNRQVQIINLGQ